MHVYAKIVKMHNENVKVVIGRGQHVTFLPESRRNKGGSWLYIPIKTEEVIDCIVAGWKLSAYNEGL